MNDPLFNYNGGTNYVPYYNGGYHRNEYQWMFNNTGQNSVLMTNGGGTNHISQDSGNVDNKIALAWNFQSSAPDILLAVIDGTGFRFDHEEFVTPYNHIKWWTNPISRRIGSRFSNGIYVTNSITATGNHGTRMLGLMAAKGNNGVGIAGVLQGGAYIMPIQASSWADIGNAIIHASTNGAKIIWLHTGVSSSRTELTNAVHVAFTNKVLLVTPFAEGAVVNCDLLITNISYLSCCGLLTPRTNVTLKFNYLDFPSGYQYQSWNKETMGRGIENTLNYIFNGNYYNPYFLLSHGPVTPNDIKPYVTHNLTNFKSGEILTNILSVGNHQRDGSAYATYYSTNYLNIHAGGKQSISLSHTSTNAYEYAGGTSDAAAITAAAAALVWQAHSNENCFQIRDRIIKSVTLTENLSTNSTSGGYLNVAAAIVKNYAYILDARFEYDSINPYEIKPALTFKVIAPYNFLISIQEGIFNEWNEQTQLYDFTWTWNPINTLVSDENGNFPTNTYLVPTWPRCARIVIKNADGIDIISTDDLIHPGPPY